MHAVNTSPHQQILPVPVNVSPLKTNQFALPKPRMDGSKKEGEMLRRMLPRLSQKDSDLSRVQRVDALMSDGCLAIESTETASWVLRDYLPLPSVIEQPSELPDDRINGVLGKALLHDKFRDELLDLRNRNLIKPLAPEIRENMVPEIVLITSPSRIANCSTEIGCFEVVPIVFKPWCGWSSLVERRPPELDPGFDLLSHLLRRPLASHFHRSPAAAVMDEHPPSARTFDFFPNLDTHAKFHKTLPVSVESFHRLLRNRANVQLLRILHPKLRQWADQHRTELVWASLTLIQAWVAAGKPLWEEQVLGSYEDWSAVMGGILAVSGVEGFLSNMEVSYESYEPEWAAFVQRWWEKFGDRRRGVGELFDIAVDSGIEMAGETDHARKVSLGKRLTERRDQVIGEYRIQRAGEAQRAALWKLVSAEK